MILYMYIAPGQGLTTPWGQNLMSTVTSCHFGHLLHVYSPGAGGESLRGRFDVNRNVLSLHSFVASFKKMSSKLILYNFFMIQYMYIAPGDGQTAPRGQNFDVNRKVLSLYPFVASFIEIPLESDFIQFLS